MPDNSQRFFYCAKVNRVERNIGFDKNDWPIGDGTQMYSKTADGTQPVTQANKLQDSKANNHPTVKPVALMKYLIQLVTPPGGKVLDPFNGSGSTGMAAVELGYDYTGIELDAKYVEIATKRIDAWYDKTHPQAFANPLFTEEE
jgi:site-specific DNA-methyltransferase (adenine-specific)